MRSFIARAVSVVLVALCCVSVGAVGNAHAVDIATFHGQAPARLLDTRPGLATVDAQFAGNGAIAGNGTMNLTVLGRGGIPSSGVGAVALNITVTNSIAAGFLTVYPSGVTRPATSNVNFSVGQTIPNMALVPVGADGQVALFNGSGGTVDVIADVLGWFPIGSSFTGLAPARLLDTRPGSATVDGLFSGLGALDGRATSNLTVLGRGGIPSTGVGAVAFNVTVTNPTAAGYLAVFPTGSTLPTSNLNHTARQTIANMVIVPLNADGQVSIFNGSGGTVDVIADVLGWFPTGISSSGIPPARLMDSRVGQTTVDSRFGGGGPIRQATTYNLVIAGRGGVPTADLGAVALNVTVTNPTAGGFLTIYPQGAARPLASNVNFAVGQTIPNMVIVPVGGGGQISIFNSAGDSDVIVDVLGWFPNPTTPATTYGNDLVLKSNGIGTALFGDPAETTIRLLENAFGSPSSDRLESPMFTNSPPVRRVVCFADGPCVAFAGFSASTLTFVGWSNDSERLIDANGVGIGSRGSDFLDGITTIGVIDLSCFPFFSGKTATGIWLDFDYDGPLPPVSDTGHRGFVTPASSQVTVSQMASGEPIGYGVCI